MLSCCLPIFEIYSYGLSIEDSNPNQIVLFFLQISWKGFIQLVYVTDHNATDAFLLLEHHVRHKRSADGLGAQ